MEKQCKFETFVYGNIWCRKMTLKAGQSKMPHVHEFDHIHLVVSGKVRVFLNDKLHGEYVSGDLIKVPAKQQHKVYAVEDSVACCLQAFRDKDLDEVIQTDFNDPNWVEPDLNSMKL